MMLALVLSQLCLTLGSGAPARAAGPALHPVDENLNPKSVGPQYAGLVAAIASWPARQLAAPAAGARPSVTLIAYETPGRPDAIGIGQSMLVLAPIGKVKGVLEDFDHYTQLFFEFKDAHGGSRDGNRLVTSWEQSIPLPFVPNTKYDTYFYIFDKDPSHVFYRYQLKTSNSLIYSDGLIVLDRVDAQTTRYTEYDFYDADWGIAATLAPARIWRDSLRGIYYSDIAIKLRAEHLDWSFDEVRKQSKQHWDDEYSDDAIGDLLKDKKKF